MFKLAYFRYLLKMNLRTWALFTAALCGMITVFMVIFTPDTMNKISTASADLPFNPLGDTSSLLGLVNGQYFGLMGLAPAMVFTVQLCIRLVVGQIDKGGFACHLSSPSSRTQLVGTSAAFVILSLAGMFSLIAAIGTIAAQIMQPGSLDIAIFLKLTAGAYLIQIAVAGIAFLASCLWSQTGKALLLGAGIPGWFFIAKLMSDMDEGLQGLKYATLITLFDGKAIQLGNDVTWQLMTLAVIGIALFAIGILTFKKRSLYI